MKRFYIIFLLLSVTFFVLLRYSPWWSLAAVAAAMLFSAYHFFRTQLEGSQTRNITLQREVDELHVQLDSSILKEQKSSKEAERAKEVKRKLLATVNHEIRTPMNGMLGMAALLVETPLNNDQREYIDTIRFCGENLLTTVNDMLVSDVLNFSKSDREGEELDKKDFDLHNCVKEVLLMFAGRAETKNSDLFYTIGTGVPEQVNGDRKRLSQVLMNLVENAITYTTKGEIFLNISNLTPPVEKPGTRGSIGLEFVLQDSGCGIAESKLAQLFKGIAVQEANDDPGAQPAGLGLVVCKKLVELMGGTISVLSVEGKGTTFRFSIFFNPAMRPKYSPLHIGQAETGTKIKLTGLVKDENTKRMLSEEFSMEYPLRILVAEDNAINQKLAMKVLGKLGYVAGLAHNGKEVLEMADLDQYDLILMDVQMPVMDGLEATRMLRLCLTKQPVIIAMTANAMDGDQNDCIQAGMDDYICKPVELNELLKKLEKWGAAIKNRRLAAS